MDSLTGNWKTGLEVGVDSSDENGVESERDGNGVEPDDGCWKRIGIGWRLERIVAGERLGDSVS
jgi:hypothetical protein